MHRLFGRIRDSEAGAALAEYAVIAAIVSVGTVLTLSAIGVNLQLVLSPVAAGFPGP